MLKLSLLIAAIVVFGYVFRKNFRRMFYVLWTGDENPDFEALEAKWYGNDSKDAKQAEGER